MYIIKYIFVNIVYHSYTILFIAVSIKNIVEGEGDKSPGMSFTRENLRGVGKSPGEGISSIPRYILETVLDWPAVTIER